MGDKQKRPSSNGITAMNNQRVPSIHLDAWRGDRVMPYWWSHIDLPDRPSTYKTRECFVGKTMTITVWSFEALSRAECLTIATAEATGKCRRLDLSKI
jgi:hypothetical protein